MEARSALSALASRARRIAAAMATELRSTADRTMDQLRYSEAHYRIASELSSDFAYTFATGPDGRPVLEWAVGAFSQITGYTIEELLRDGWTRLVHPDDLPLTAAHGQRLAAGESDVVEYRIVTRSGEVRWLRDAARPVADKTGKVVRVYGAAQDITARKRAETSLHQALDSLAEARAQLEQRVSERTAELEHTNQALSREIAERKQIEESLRLTMVALQASEELHRELNVINADINSTLDFDEIMQRVMVESAAALHCESSSVILRENHGWVVRYVYGLPADVVGRHFADEEMPLGTQALSSNDAVVSENMLADGAQPINTREFRVHSAMVVPLVRRGHTIGAVYFNYHSRPVQFSPAQIDFGRKLAASVTLALDNARLYSDMESRVEERTAELYQTNAALREEIAERERAEASLRQAADELAQQARRLREQADLLDLTNDAIIVRDMQAHIQFWNRGAQERYGWRAEEVLGLRSHDLFRTVFPTSEKQVYAELLEHGSWEGELIHTKRDGGQIYVDARWSLRRDVAGRPVGVLEINNDVTERRAAERRLERQSQRLQMLHEIDVGVLAAQSAAQIAGAAVSRIRQLVPCERASVVLFDFERQEAERVALDVEGAIAQENGQRMTLADYGIPSEQFAGAHRLIEDVARLDERSPVLAQVAGGGMRSFLSMPLHVQGRLIGDLNLAAVATNAFTGDDIDSVRQVADSLAVAIQNARLHEGEQRARRIAETLAAANLALTRSLDLRAVLATLLDSLEKLVPYDCAQIMLLDDSGCLAIHAVRDRSAPPGAPDTYEPGTTGEVGRTIDLRTAPVLRQALDGTGSLLISDTAGYPDWAAASSLASMAGMGSWLGVPLRAADKAIGLCSIGSTTPGSFTSQHVRPAEALGAQGTTAIQNAQLFAQVEASRRKQQSLTRRLVEVQEAERRSIARELHDEAGQALTTLMINLGLLEKEAGQTDAVVHRAQDMKQVTNNVMEGLHRLSVNLRPASLDRLGLVAAVRQYADEIQERGGPEIDLVTVGLDDGNDGDGADASAGRLPSEMETMLYRLVQEALTNVVRHAGASHVGVVLERHADRVVAIIEDDGAGFDPQEAQSRGRLGLLGMRERAEMLNGKLSIESAPGSGTTVYVEAPIMGDAKESRAG